MNKVKLYNEYLESRNNFDDLLRVHLYECLSENDKFILRKIDYKRVLINEGFVNTISNHGKEILKKLADRYNNIKSFLENIRLELSRHITEVLTTTKNKLKEKLKVNTVIIDSIKKEVNSDKNAFLHDMKTCQQVSEFYTSKFKDSIINNVMDSLHKLFLRKEKTIKECVLNEGLDLHIIDNLIKHIHKIPPFAWLDMLHHKGTEGAEHLINGLSYITKHLGGPEFKLPVISSLLGLVFEYNIKGFIKHGLIEAAEIFTLPFVSIVIKTAGNIASFLALHELCKEIIASVEEHNGNAAHKPALAH